MPEANVNIVDIQQHIPWVEQTKSLEWDHASLRPCCRKYETNPTSLRLLNNISIFDAGQPNLVGWSHPTGLEPHIEGRPREAFGQFRQTVHFERPCSSGVVSSDRLFIVDLFPCTTAVGLPSPAVQVRHLVPVFSYPQPFTSSRSKNTSFTENSLTVEENMWTRKVAPRVRETLSE